MSDTTETVIKISWTEVSTALKSAGGLKLTQFAKEKGLAAPTLRKMIEERYGANVEFRRGRYGGAFWVADKTPAKAVTKTEATVKPVKTAE